MAKVLPQSAQVVIIGGGIVGASVAYHLTELGWTDVVLLERHTLTSGTTWHAAGLIGCLKNTHNMTRLADYSADLYERLETEMDLPTGFKKVGSVSLADNPGRMEELVRLAAMANCFEALMGAVFLDGGIDVTDRVFGDAMEKCAEDMEFFNLRIDTTLLETLQGIMESDFVRLPYTEAVEILEKSGESFEFPVQWGVDLQSEHERFLTETHFQSPVILYDYPKTIKPFYMYCNDDDKTVRGMDVLVPKIGEIIGGSQREHRLDVLEQRMKDQDLVIEDYWWYTDLRKYGTVPHAGFGLGLERLVQFVTGMSNIRDVIPFPRTPGSADF